MPSDPFAAIGERVAFSPCRRRLGAIVPSPPDPLSYKRLRAASEEIRAAGPPAFWSDCVLDPRQGEIIGVIEDFAFVLIPWMLLVQINGRWLALKHARLIEAFDALGPRIGDVVRIVCLGRSNKKEDRRAYRYEVEIAGRVWRDGALQ